MIIVLHTSGKSQDVDNVEVRLFDNPQDAQDYCKKNTDDPMDEKYWNYCQVITEAHRYEMARYNNWY